MIIVYLFGNMSQTCLQKLAMPFHPALAQAGTTVFQKRLCESQQTFLLHLATLSLDGHNDAVLVDLRNAKF